MSELSRLQWKCRRGMLELDLLLQGFLEHGYACLDEEGKAAFGDLLGYQDQRLFDYLLGNARPTDARIARLIDLIKQGAAS